MTASSLNFTPPKGGSFLAKMGEVMFSGIPTGAETASENFHVSTRVGETQRKNIKLWFDPIGLFCSSLLSSLSFLSLLVRS